MTGFIPYKKEIGYHNDGLVSENTLKNANAFRDRQIRQAGATTLEVYLAK